jgi:hypothetical protein
MYKRSLQWYEDIDAYNNTITNISISPSIINIISFFISSVLLGL